MASYSLKLTLKIAADGDMDTINSLNKVATALSAGTIADPLRLTVHPQYRMISLP